METVTDNFHLLETAPFLDTFYPEGDESAVTKVTGEMSGSMRRTVT